MLLFTVLEIGLKDRAPKLPMPGFDHADEITHRKIHPFWSQMKHRYFFFGVFIELSLMSFSYSVSADSGHPKPGPGNATCPLDFQILRDLYGENAALVFLDIPTECLHNQQNILVVRSSYLRSSGNFSLPSNSEESCWNKFDSAMHGSFPDFDSRSTCGIDNDLMSITCMNITTRSELETLVPKSKLQEIRDSCSRSLDDDSNCASCKHSLTDAFSPVLGEITFGNASITNCSWYPSAYASAFMNRFGPTDPRTASCLFLLNPVYLKKIEKERKINVSLAVVGIVGGFLVLLIVAWIIWRKRGVQRMRKRTATGDYQGNESDFVMELARGDAVHTNLVKFSYDEIKMATKNFSKEHMIGRGGYGNVYYGKLEDGSEVAVKRFKNCSAGGDMEFTHEVEVIASVRHVNLIGLRGYCTATLPVEGHQRMIVSDMMQNRSLSDHLFNPSKEKLSWPVRQKIALGVARGLAYLHFGAQPGIIHRDVKVSNILLDESFEPKLADFGFSKFTQEDTSHLSTRVAGTLGYIAPEYALYGQLTERSDVYGFGVVLLELLSGKRAVISVSNNETLLLTDWAWSLVRQDKIMDVIDENMPSRGSMDVMEKYVVVAVLSTHPVLYARPMMDQIVKVLESDDLAPLIHDRDLRCSSETDGVELHQASSGSGGKSGPVDQEQPRSLSSNL